LATVLQAENSVLIVVVVVGLPSSFLINALSRTPMGEQNGSLPTETIKR